MNKYTFKRLQNKLQKNGVKIERYNSNIIHVESLNTYGLKSKILLPENFNIEEKAINQLLDFSNIAHPDGGHVKCSCATPDFHSGTDIPVGSIVVTDHSMVIPRKKTKGCPVIYYWGEFCCFCS